MTKDTFISFVRLVKKIHNQQQEANDKGHGYLNALAASKAICEKMDAQCKLIDKNQEFLYEWLPRFVHYVREWRKEQKLYQETQYDSGLQKCRDLDRILERGFMHIKSNSPEVLTNPNNQTALPWP